MTTNQERAELIERYVSKEIPDYLVTADDRTFKTLARSSDPIQALDSLIERHREHRKKQDCECPWGQAGATAVGIGDTGLMFVVSEINVPGVITHQYYIYVDQLPEDLRGHQQAPLPS